MEPNLYISFIIASVVLIIIPGPNVLVIVSTSVAHGAGRGLQTVAGTSSAMVVQLLVAALGTSWVVRSVSEGFSWLRWLGVVYLVYLGASHLVRLFKSADTEYVPETGRGTFARGFAVSLTNPKTILFFSAFLPQFVSSDEAYLGQIMLLSVTFLVLATVLDSLYALLAGRLGGLARASFAQRVQHGVSGVLYLAAGAWLAALRRS
ncbi:MAG: LysE family translocator [Gammaproteobacteria bacterium]|nr:LysE family translocator [Gammaproteobacteria bacterium]